MRRGPSGREGRGGFRGLNPPPKGWLAGRLQWGGGSREPVPGKLDSPSPCISRAMSQVTCPGGGSGSPDSAAGAGGSRNIFPLVRTERGEGEDGIFPAEPPSSLLQLVLGKAEGARQSRLARVGGEMLWERSKHLVVRFGLETGAGESPGEGADVAGS